MNPSLADTRRCLDSLAKPGPTLVLCFSQIGLSGTMNPQFKTLKAAQKLILFSNLYKLDWGPNEA